MPHLPSGMGPSRQSPPLSPPPDSGGFCVSLARATEPAENLVWWRVDLIETELQMVERHIREGEVRVLRQREIVRELFDHNHPTALAEQLLLAFEQTLLDHRAHLTRLNSPAR